VGNYVPPKTNITESLDRIETKRLKKEIKKTKETAVSAGVTFLESC